MPRYLAIIPLFILLSACGTAKALLAMTRSTDHFQVLQNNPSIHYENGTEAYAATLARHLHDAGALVAERQYGTFPDGVTIFVAASMESFAKYCASDAPSACVIGSRLFMSPKLSGDEARAAVVLVHELSHLQLSQSLGRWTYQRNVPAWFAEGLAVFVADGGGAERVSAAEAKAAIRAGRQIVPIDAGSLLFRQTASRYGMVPHMFYRQSAMYVAWLHDLDAGQFRQLFQRLHAGDTVGEAILASYGFTAQAGWTRFANDLQAQGRLPSQGG